MNRKLTFPIRRQWMAAHNGLNLIRDSWHKTAFRGSSISLTHMQKYRLKFLDSSADQDHPSEDKNHFSDHMERLIAAKTSNLGDKLHKLIITVISHCYRSDIYFSMLIILRYRFTADIYNPPHTILPVRCAGWIPANVVVEHRSWNSLCCVVWNTP